MHDKSRIVGLLYTSTQQQQQQQQLGILMISYAK